MEATKITKTELIKKIGRIVLYMLIMLTTLVIIGKQHEKTQRLKGPVLSVSDITPDTLTNSLQLTKMWYKNNINSQTKIFNYQYDPTDDTYLQDKNHVRQLATAWAMTNVELYLNNHVPEDFINPFIEYYLKRITYKDNYAFLELHKGDACLAYNAFLIQILLNSEFKDKETIIQKLAEGILHVQREDGSYQTNMIDPAKKSGMDYYPGEAMLALINLYKVTKNESYLKSIEKAFPYYRTYWRSHKNTAFVPWQTEAYVALFEYTKDPELKEFVIEMNNWLIEKQYTSGDPHKLGGFGPLEPTSSTSVYLEGINDAYKMLIKYNEDKSLIQKYRNAIILGTRYTLQTQYTNKNTYFASKSIILGGFRGGITRYEVRIDMSQHGSMAVLKALQNKIFH